MDKLPMGEPVFAVEDTIAQSTGTVETQVQSDYPVCVLWVPDPEQRHGWREFYVQRQVIKPGMKKMGYKK